MYSLCAVTNMTSNSFADSSVSKSSPVLPGICISRKTRSGSVCRICCLANAALELVAVTTTNAENVSWYQVNKGFVAKFTINDLMYQVLFNRKGRLVYKITYGKETHLPPDIRKMVKGNYVEFIITAASLVEEADRKIWVINIEDDSKYVIVRVENNEMDENLKYKKYH